MASRQDYIVTNHARERFVQRTNKRYAHLQDCRVENCEACRRLIDDCQKFIETHFALVSAELAIRLDEAEENKSYVNNTGFMGWYYEKYGYDKRFEFLVDKEVLFVVVLDRGKKIVVTCVPVKSHLAGKAHRSRKKFNRILTKEEKEMAQNQT